MRNGKRPASNGSNEPDALTKAVRSNHAIVALDHLSRAMPQRVSSSATVCLTLALAACGGGSNQAGSAGPAAPTGIPAGSSTDYSLAAHWVCRPGTETTCTTGLDATVQYADGHTEPQPFTPAADPPIDCFYVYPTESKEQTPYADLANSPEIQTITKAQVGRLSSRCRVFAPIYRQVTGYGLHNGVSITNSDVPMLDVRAAWAYYLQNDNKGRGVVLIGHSQGTILLQYLIADSIDGRSSQALLVSAFLAGDPSLGVPPGGVVGGTFAHIPTCREAAQTGCVYVWGSFLPGDTSAPPVFGGARTDGLATACVNPAAPAGGSGMLKFYYEGKNPPWVEAVGQISGACQTESGANIFVVTVQPGRFADHNTTILNAAEIGHGWGIHPRDIALVQGNILDVLDAEIATWKAQH
jgi:hypothetical protein